MGRELRRQWRLKSMLLERVSEVGFKDDSVKLVSSQKIHVNAGHISCKSCSDSSSESIRSKSRELETEALIAVCTGNNEDNVVTNRHFSEETSKEVGSEPGQLVEEVSLASEKITNRSY
ncbi:hypothetical protein V6N13_110245 [Hibiscus sabdariffa]|uniref:Uncharacterized protein n=2 Tax=Hibiscus sabdariffa TaxID=183260 RepID=A0ABR2AF11_9ROSI